MENFLSNIRKKYLNVKLEKKYLNAFIQYTYNSYLCSSNYYNSSLLFEDLSNKHHPKMDSDRSDNSDTFTPLKRGVKIWTKRGKYRAYSTEKKRIISVAEDYEGDWESAAIANGVSIATAYAWIRNGSKETWWS